MEILLKSKLEQLEKELKQTKLNFKNSQTHSKNCYKKLKEKFERGKEVYHRNYELIQENGKLKQENQELKERYKKRAEISNELCEALKKYEKVFEILIDNLGIKIKHRVYDKDDGGVADDWFIDCAVFNESLTEEEYELVKQVFESVGGE